jgi:putative transposase
VVSSQVAPWAARGRDTIARACGDQEVGLDWGAATLATLAYALREYAEEGNDRPLAAAQEAPRVESRVLSKALRGRCSKRAAKAKTALARRHRRVANCHKERNHQLTARIVRGHKLIVTEGAGAVEHEGIGQGHGTEAQQKRAKAGLNRAILDATPGSFLNMLGTKAEEAGCEPIVLNTRREKPSQTRPWW